MRPIKFRGFHQISTGKNRAFISGKWLSGDWVTSHVFATHQIGKGEGAGIVWLLTHIDEQNTDNINTYDVIPETVGQFTGLLDKNGVEIYEGDILLSTNSKSFGVVKYWTAAAGFGVCDESEYITPICCLGNKKCWYYEVIGNIYENSELLREAGKDGAQSAVQDVFAPAT